MSEKPLPFVITDRRKFNAEGETRPDADPSPEREPRPETLVPEPVAEISKPVEAAPEPQAAAEPEFPPAPTDEQMEQSRLAYETTAERIDTAVRAANPGAEHPPAMTLDQLIQSVYMQCIMQLGGGTPEGQQPQVDILGARSSIDLLGILDDKTKGNLTATEQLMLSSAIFELRLAFLEITQALARTAQQRAAAGPPPPGAGGPRIVR
jgi:Domain of unknown function (DUF1844)